MACTPIEKKIILVTGGQRSGKSSFAEAQGQSLSDHPVYIATSRIWDQEHQRRIDRHKADRSQAWQTIEEERQLSIHHLPQRVIVVDCVTLWATNFFYDLQDVDRSIEAVIDEFDRFTSQEAYFIFVTNEIGLGGTSDNLVQRQFTDILGRINQYIARQADEVYMLVSGISLKIKG